MNPMMINPQRGEIWLVNFNPQVGDEMGKARPALVFSVGGMSRLELRIIIPITDWKDAFHHHYTKVQLYPTRQNGLTKPSAADAFQVKSVSLQRFVGSQPLGRLPLADLTDIGIALKVATGIA
jgi:mRNA interferase MazF